MSDLAEQAAQARGAGVRLPDFFVIGHAKCGTTALYEMLRSHPQVYMCEPKEPWFFARDNPRPRGSGPRTVAVTGTEPVSLEKYLSLFAAAGGDQRAGDASTSYIWSPIAAARIADVQPAARIVAILREPASFLRAVHLQLLKMRRETEPDFRRAVALEESRLQGREIPKANPWPQTLIYTHRVRYVEQLRRYADLFAREQMLVLIYDDFKRDNEATVRRVLRFLDVDDTHPIETVRANPTIGTSVRADDLRRGLARSRSPAARAVRTAGRALTTSGLRERVYHPAMRRLAHGKPPAEDEQFMLELRRRFKREVEAVSEYLGRDLVALWGYDALD
jgi:Sulfotransferase family